VEARAGWRFPAAEDHPWHPQACNHRQRGTYQEESAGDKKGFLMDLLRIIIAILLPPLGVFLQVGIGKQFWINILLTILGYIPGIVHAVWVIAKY
jgi:uncharacterized membrane protein YqaE (UPF0057 family)